MPDSILIPVCRRLDLVPNAHKLMFELCELPGIGDFCATPAIERWYLDKIWEQIDDYKKFGPKPR